MEDGGFALLAIIYSALCAGVCYFGAMQKNRSSGWLFVGALLGVFGIMMIAMANRLKPVPSQKPLGTKSYWVDGLKYDYPTKGRS